MKATKTSSLRCRGHKRILVRPGRRWRAGLSTGKVLKTATGDVEVTPQLAKQIYKYLLKNDYSDDNDRITGTYHEAKKGSTLAPLPRSCTLMPTRCQLIDSVFSDSQMFEIGDDRRPKNPLNNNFDKQEFKAVEPDQSQGSLQR